MYHTRLINARTHEEMARVIADVRAAGAVVVMRTEDLAGAPPRPTPHLSVKMLNLVSGAHATGSRPGDVLVGCLGSLTAPFLDFVRSEYVPLHEQDGFVALGPRGR